MGKALPTQPDVEAGIGHRQLVGLVGIHPPPVNGIKARACLMSMSGRWCCVSNLDGSVHKQLFPKKKHQKTIIRIFMDYGIYGWFINHALVGETCKMALCESTSWHLNSSLHSAKTDGSRLRNAEFHTTHVSCRIPGGMRPGAFGASGTLPPGQRCTANEQGWANMPWSQKNQLWSVCTKSSVILTRLQGLQWNRYSL